MFTYTHKAQYHETDQMGIIREVCVEDASPVEYGTVLFYLEPMADATPGSPDASMGEGE